MATIIPFPIKQLDEFETAVRLWELVMAGRRDSDDFRRLQQDLERKASVFAPAFS